MAYNDNEKGFLQFHQINVDFHNNDLQKRYNSRVGY